MTTDVFSRYPTLNESLVDSLLNEEISKSHIKLVVLDDDPTGVQTVHDVSVYTSWDAKSLRKAFEEESRVFFILTNSRGMNAEESSRVHEEIAHNVSIAARVCGKAYLYMSRSDSTLRGHYPLETSLLKNALERLEGRHIDGEILCPFFKEGGRFTIDNVHYVQYGAELVPAAQTEFAKDKTFGYTSSALPAYVEEKTGGEYKAKDVVCISLDMIRALAIDSITDQLMQVTDFNKICVNAIDYVDLKVFSIALYRAMAHGKSFMFRTAASLVKVMGGISDRPLLCRREMMVQQTQNGGLVVVGSHTQKTTAQLNALLRLDGIVGIPFNSDLILEGDEALEAEIQRCVFKEAEVILAGRTAVCFTNRTLLSLPGDTKESALARSVKISNGVQRLVSDLAVKPAFIVAKGGITSNDVGVKALRVRCARVMGQIYPGIPVWQTDAQSKFPAIPYIIFPGNVGEENTLRSVIEKLL